MTPHVMQQIMPNQKPQITVMIKQSSATIALLVKLKLERSKLASERSLKRWKFKTPTSLAKQIIADRRWACQQRLRGHVVELLWELPRGIWVALLKKKGIYG